MLKDAETRTEIFTEITNNQAYLTEFMDSLHNNLQAMEIMPCDKEKIGGFMDKDNTMMKNRMGKKGMY